MTLKFASIFGRKGFERQSSASAEKLCLGGWLSTRPPHGDSWCFSPRVNIECKHSAVDELLRIFQTMRGKRLLAGVRMARWKANAPSLVGLEALWKSSFFARREESARTDFHSETERTFKTEDTFLFARASQVKFITEYWDFINQVACAGSSIRRLEKLPSRPTQPRSLHNNFLLRKSHFLFCMPERSSLVCSKEQKQVWKEEKRKF